MTLVVRDAVELHVVRYVVERRRGVAAVVAADAARLGNVRYLLRRRRRRRNLRLYNQRQIIRTSVRSG